MFFVILIATLGTIYLVMLPALSEGLEDRSEPYSFTTFSASIKRNSNSFYESVARRQIKSIVQDTLSQTHRIPTIFSRSDTSPSSFKSGDLCAIQGQISALVNHTIYFLGGASRIITNGESVSDWGPEHLLYSIDLSESFPVETLLRQNFTQNSTIPLSVVPNLINQTEQLWNGALFATNDSFYVYGGANPAQNLLASYNTTSKTWAPVPISGGELSAEPRYQGQSASDPTSGLSFYSGGRGEFSGMIRFDASKPTTVSWTNETEGAQGDGDSSPDRLGGGMVYIPKGTSGILLSMGGADPMTFSDSADTWDFFSFGLIDVYDIASKTWYAVKATGTSNNAPSTLPNGRAEFCLGVSRAPDDSSFQVTLYGGTLENTTYYNDVWVLSIPSFQWIAVNDTNNRDRATSGSDAGRKGHFCTVWEDSQMIVMGGIYEVPAAKEVKGGDVCDMSHSPIRLLDTSTYSWNTEYKPGIPYTVPSVVSDMIGGDSSGKSDLTAPLGGWSHSELADIFSKTLPRSQAATSGSQQQPSPVATPSGEPSSTPQGGSKSSTGAIVGGVVAGSVVVIAVIVAAIWYRSRRRKSKMENANFPQNEANPELPSNETRHELPQNAVNPELDGNPFSELPPSTVEPTYELSGQSRHEVLTNR